MTASRGFRWRLVLLALSLCTRAGAQTTGTTSGITEPDAGTTTEAVKRCVSDHERTRLSIVGRRWQEARAAAERCASEACPLSLRADCRDWLLELADRFASVIVIVETESGKGTEAQLSLDGKPMPIDRLGAPLVLAPGSYRLRFELPPYPAIEREIVLAEGEKNRLVSVRFGRAPGLETQLAPADEARPEPKFSSPVPALTYALAGGAVLSGAASAGLFFSARSERDQALEDCAPNCNGGVRDSIERKLLFADITAGAALTFAAVAFYTYLRRPRVPVVSVGGAAPTFRLGLAETAVSFGLEAMF